MLLNDTTCCSTSSLVAYADSAAKVPKVSPERVPAGSDILIELSAQAGLVSAKDMSHNIGNPEPGATATSTSKASDSAQATDAMHEELLLMPNSASSNKARHGGSIYDMLVQEIKSLKLQQKLAPRQFAELQKNMSVYVNRTAAEISALQQSVQLLQSEVRLLKRSKNASEKLEFSGAAVATSSDVEIDLRALHHQLEVVRAALHIVQHRVTAIVLMAMVAWLAVMVLTAPDLGRMTWILYVPIIMISAIGVLWLAGVLRILPNHFTVP